MTIHIYTLYIAECGQSNDYMSDQVHVKYTEGNHFLKGSPCAAPNNTHNLWLIYFKCKHYKCETFKLK